MNNGMMMDVDPLSPYEAQYEYPHTNASYFHHPPLPAPYTQPHDYPQNPYQLPPLDQENYEPNVENTTIEEPNPTSEVVEEEDIKPDIVQLETGTKPKKKTKGKTSNYWNKKIVDKDFAFYGCSVCNIAYTDLQKLDQHVLVHSDRLTSYDLRLINLRKRKLLKKAKKKLKKQAKIKQEFEIEIKPEDGYIGTETALEFNETVKSDYIGTEKALEFNETVKSDDIGTKKTLEFNETVKSDYIGTEKALEFNETVKSDDIGTKKTLEFNETVKSDYIGTEKALEFNETVKSDDIGTKKTLEFNETVKSDYIGTEKTLEFNETVKSDYIGTEKALELNETVKSDYIGTEKALEFNETVKSDYIGTEKALELNETVKSDYIGTEKALEFNETVKSDIKPVKNNENNPLNKNESKQNHVNVYKCFGCNKQFALSYYLRIHVRSHTDEKPYTCAQCGQCFITASKLGRHTKRVHLAVRHQCRICYKTFSRFELLVKHFDSKHPDDKLEGEPYDYNAILPYLKELEEQLKQETDKKPKTEDPWGLPPVTGAAGLTMEVDALLTDDQKTADMREEIFLTKQEDKVDLPSNYEFYDENREISVNYEMKEVKVDFDIKAVKQEIDDQGDDHHIDNDHDDDHIFSDHNLDDHDPGFQASGDAVKNENVGTDDEYVPSRTWVRPHSPLIKKRKRNGPTTCPICNKEISKKSNLQVHMRSHTGEKPFPCTVCKRGYSSALALKRHSVVHDKLKEEKDVKPKKEPKTETDETTTEKLEVSSDNENAKDDPGSDEEYFPSKTWARSPSPLPEPSDTPARRSKTTCEICNKQLCSKTYLAVHMRTHTGEKPFSCYICNRGFITASKMHRHVLTHDESWEGKDGIKPEDDAKVKVESETEGKEDGEEKPNEESMEKAKTRLLLKKSKKTFFEKKGKESKKWTHVCEFCNQKFLHLETLQVHRKCHNESENMKCYYCLEAHTEQEALKAHEASHVGPKPYLCTLCGHRYTKRGPMIYHRKKCKGSDESNETKKYLCEFCNKGYSTHSKLQRHLASHSVSQYTLRYECPVCAHMFHTRYHVSMHLRSHIKEGLILEENRSSVLAMVLQNARKIPKSTDIANIAASTALASTALPTPVLDPGADERSRICNICGQIFQHFYYLEEHLKTHGTKMALEDLDEEEEKKHTCQVCSKSFKLPYYLKLHSYTHTKEKPFICQTCGKGFITKGKLKRHLETHQGLKKYQCHICYKFFTRPSYLRIHVRTIHGTQDYNFRDYGIGVPIGALTHE